MEEERQLEQTDRKRMRSISVLIRCDIRFRSSHGSSDQSAFIFNDSMDDDADFLFLVLGFFFTWLQY